MIIIITTRARTALCIYIYCTRSEMRSEILNYLIVDHHLSNVFRRHIVWRSHTAEVLWKPRRSTHDDRDIRPAEDCRIRENAGLTEARVKTHFYCKTVINYLGRVYKGKVFFSFDFMLLKLLFPESFRHQNIDRRYTPFYTRCTH